MDSQQWRDGESSKDCYTKLGTLTILMGPFGSDKSWLLDPLSSWLATNSFLSDTISSTVGKLSCLSQPRLVRISIIILV